LARAAADAPLVQILVGVAGIEPSGSMPERGRVPCRRRASTGDPAPERTGDPLRGATHARPAATEVLGKVPQRGHAAQSWATATIRRATSHSSHGELSFRHKPLHNLLCPRRRARVARRHGAGMPLAARSCCRCGSRPPLKTPAGFTRAGGKRKPLLPHSLTSLRGPYREPQQVPKQRMLWHVVQGASGKSAKWMRKLARSIGSGGAPTRRPRTAYGGESNCLIKT